MIKIPYLRRSKPIKLFGIILIILAGTGIGFKASENLLMQNNQLKKLRQMLTILRGEIKFNNSTLAQAMDNIKGRVAEPLDEFLAYVASNLNEYSGTTLKKIWENGINEVLSKSYLSKKQLGRLKELGDNLGFLDMEMQLATIDLFIEQLNQEIEENDKKTKDNCKLYKYLGFMGGILVILIIT